MAPRTRVLFLSPLFSPFQIEVGDAVNRETNLDYRIAFGRRERRGRGQPHWVRFQYDRERYTTMPDGGGKAVEWYANEVRRLQPDVVIAGQPVGATYAAVLRTWREAPYSLGFWLEGMDPTRPWYRRGATAAAMRLRLSFADFILAIGDRAERYFRRAAPRSAVHLLPYGEDLSPCLEAKQESKPEGPLRFLFSGQLQRRHNIDKILEAAAKLATTHPGSFELVLSGSGPEQSTIDRFVAEHPRVREAVCYDRDFETWTDRLRPFRESHVFVYPCDHAGWGLVIPEAMAAAMPVITTRGTEAGRYYVRHRVTGVFIQPTAADLFREMNRFVECPDLARRMGERAREVAREGHAPQIAARLAEIVHGEVRRSKPRDSRTELAFTASRGAFFPAGR